MAGLENVRAVSAFDGDGRYGSGVNDIPPEKPNNPLDSEKNKRKHSTLISWFEMERQRQSYNRYQQALDEDFYDNIQWSEEDAAEVMERGQAPLVYNRVAPSVDWITGMEKRMRVDFKVLPREKDDIDGAISKTKLLKYVGDVNRVPFLRSRAFEDTVKVGIGWMEDGAQTDPEKDPVYADYVNWREIWWDSHARKRDLTDARYLFRVKWADLDIAMSMFPDRRAALKAACVSATAIGREDDDDGYYLGQRLDETDFRAPSNSRRQFLSDSAFVDNRRERVKLIEAWYRVPEVVEIMVGGPFARQVFDKKNAQHVACVKSGECELFRNLRMAIWVAMMTEGHLLSLQRSPYKHDRFPYTAFWCFQRGRDGLPYGYIRRVRDIQEDLNKRASKALFMLSTNQLIADRDAFDDWDEAREEASRPDGVLMKKKGSDVEIRRDGEIAGAHMELMQMDARMIQEIGGTTDDNLGRKTNAISGEAIRARQDQGMAVTASAFDNLRYGIQLEGEMELSLVEQFFSAPKVVRITNGDENDGYEWLEINQPQLRPDGTVEFLNDITARKADFVVDQEQLSQTIRQSMFEYLMNVIAKLPPELAIQLLDLAIEFADLPGYEKWVARIKKLSGHEDPPDENSTPEEQADYQARQQAAKAEAELQQRAMLAEIREKEAKINDLNARAEKAKAETAEILTQVEQLRNQTGADGPTEQELALIEELQAQQQKAEDDRARAEDEIRGLRADIQNRENEIVANYVGKVEVARINAQSKEKIAKSQPKPKPAAKAKAKA